MPVEKRRLFHACLVFVVTVELFLFPLLITPFFNAPPEPYDAADYDAIALQLARGNGYSVDWDSPEYRSLYAGNPAYAYLDTHTGAYLTAFRPPLYPLLMAGVYRVFGRVFYPLRVINVLALALACSLGFLLASRWAGIGAGYLFVLLFEASPPLHDYSARILTEVLACLLVMLLLWLLVSYTSTARRKYLLFAGIVAGLSILNRSIMLVWLAPLAALVLLALPKRGVRFGLLSTGLFVGAALIAVSPWMVRNTIVLGQFMPFGTHSGIYLPAAYSDAAVARKGGWINLPEKGYYQDLQAHLSGLELEKAMAQRGQAAGMEWIKTHPLQVIALAWYKIADLWRPETIWTAALYLLALVGLLVHPKKSDLYFPVGFLAANTFAVAVTWNFMSRFQVPVLAVLYLLAAICLARVGSAAVNRYKKSRRPA